MSAEDLLVSGFAQLDLGQTKLKASSLARERGLQWIAVRLRYEGHALVSGQRQEVQEIWTWQTPGLARA